MSCGGVSDTTAECPFVFVLHTLPTPGENQSLFPPHGAWNIYINNSCSLLKWSFREACSLLQKYSKSCPKQQSLRYNHI
uniref:Uncharacterized protein n=1 Tax=Aegilops tauschii subsp. strangulata TaxID=200361 RepID=A0A452Y1B4_AEGTS